MALTNLHVRVTREGSSSYSSPPPPTVSENEKKNRLQKRPLPPPPPPPLSGERFQGRLSVLRLCPFFARVWTEEEEERSFLGPLLSFLGVAYRRDSARDSALDPSLSPPCMHRLQSKKSSQIHLLLLLRLGAGLVGWCPPPDCICRWSVASRGSVPFAGNSHTRKFHQPNVSFHYPSRKKYWSSIYFFYI